MLDRIATDSQRDASLRSEQIQAVCANQLFSVPMNCMLAASIIEIARDDVKTSVLLCWFVFTLVINTGRMILALQSQRSSAAQRTDGMLRLNGLLMLAAGCLWAVVPGLMFDITNARAPYILFVLAGISAAATVQAGTYSVGAIAFVLPIFGTLIYNLLTCGAERSYMIALDGVLYLVFLVASARKGEKALVRTVLLRIEATALAVSLDREHTASKASAARFFELANHDTLTGLANRAAFSTTLNGWLERAQQQSGGFYLLLLDLDHFKSINDTLGHSAGDEILKEAANRLRQAIDGDHIVARLGGDEFAILFAPTVGSSETMSSKDVEAERVASHLLSKVSGAFHLGEHAVSIGVSIGVAKYPDDGATVEDLLAHADLALYAAKDGGRHRWRRFDATLLADATMARDIEHDLTAALDDGSMQVFYQPQISLGDHRLAGLEALLRWNHPVHGWIAPPAVVAAARRIRKSELLTSFVLDQACRQILRLCDEGVTDVLVAINVSPSELDHYALPALIERAVAEHGIDPQRLEVEITEEAFAASESALATLSRLSAMGVRLAIDDFGTGYSSIAYLRSMRVDRIKIDRSFVTGFADRAGDRILVQAILGIGRSFGIEVLAEGVETADDVVLLKAFGCAVVQGYYFGRPLAPDALTAWLAARRDDCHVAAEHTTTRDRAPGFAAAAA